MLWNLWLLIRWVIAAGELASPFWSGFRHCKPNTGWQFSRTRVNLGEKSKLRRFVQNFGFGQAWAHQRGRHQVCKASLPGGEHCQEAAAGEGKDVGEEGGARTPPLLLKLKSSFVKHHQIFLNFSHTFYSYSTIWKIKLNRNSSLTFTKSKRAQWSWEPSKLWSPGRLAQSPEPREPRAQEPRAQSPGSPDHEL